MPSICLYLQVHQPKRLRKLSLFDFEHERDLEKLYFDSSKNRHIFERIAKKSYIPTNSLLLELIRKYNLKLSLGLTGTFIEQCLEYMPEVLDGFKALVRTGNVELLSETYYHSLSSLYETKDEFIAQIEKHKKTIRKHFNYEPKIFRNTELIYSNAIARIAESLGYKGILAEGINLGWRSPNYIYKPKNCARIKLLLRNYQLSDDVSFRFSAHAWNEYPLTADKYALWLSKCEGDMLNLFMDYETFGEHQWQETGIFEFLKYLPAKIKNHKNLGFLKISEALEKYSPVGEYDSPNVTTWADIERDASAWLGNDMQKNCFNELKALENQVKSKNDPALLHIWRLLQTADTIYYISTKGYSDECVHRYFAEHQSPYDVFINYMNIIQDLKSRLEK